MIICRQYGFAFIHIPKCAGTSLREEIDRVRDTEEFADVRAHPVLGQIDYGHIPLRTLRDYFPDQFALVEEYFSFCVVRDPYARFGSSLSQHLMMYGAMSPRKATRAEWKHALDNSIDHLASLDQGANLDFKFIHFQRQNDFVTVDGKRVIENLYACEDLNKLASDLRGITKDRIFSSCIQKRGAGTVYRKPVAQLLRSSSAERVVKAVWSTLPVKVKGVLRRTMESSRDARYGDLFQSQYVKEFIAHYYRDDIALYQSVLTAAQNGK